MVVLIAAPLLPNFWTVSRSGHVARTGQITIGVAQSQIRAACDWAGVQPDQANMHLGPQTNPPALTLCRIWPAE